MSWLYTLIIGAIVGLLYGWASSRKMGTWYNIVTGIVGAITGYWLFIDVLKFGTMNTSIGHFNGMSLIWEVIGSIVVMAIVGALEHRSVEQSEMESRRVYTPGVAHEYKKEERWEKYKKDDRDKFR